MELENLIKSNVIFQKENGSGFLSTRCPVCMDYQARLGMKFEFGSVGANCFNCGFKTRYNESDGYVSKKFKQLLLAFNIDEDDISKCLAVNFINLKTSEDKIITLETIKKVNLNTPEVPLPEGSILLKDANQPHLVKYLESRKFSVDDYPWYCISTDHKDEYYKNRVIIPYFRNGKIIYWQARSINPLVKKRYLNCEVQKAAVIFGYDELYSWSNKPLFITEGVFDAINVKGVCLLGSVLSEEALTILKRTKRRVIFVVDKDKNGKKLAHQVIDHGYEITFAPTGSSDVNDSIIKNGKLFTVWHLLNNTSKGFVAKTKVNLTCSRK